jgi:hypothetical protein
VEEEEGKPVKPKWMGIAGPRLARLATSAKGIAGLATSLGSRKVKTDEDAAFLVGPGGKCSRCPSTHFNFQTLVSRVKYQNEVF